MQPKSTITTLYQWLKRFVLRNKAFCFTMIHIISYLFLPLQDFQNLVRFVYPYVCITPTLYLFVIGE